MSPYVATILYVAEEEAEDAAVRARIFYRRARASRGKRGTRYAVRRCRHGYFDAAKMAGVTDIPTGFAAVTLIRHLCLAPAGYRCLPFFNSTYLTYAPRAQRAARLPRMPVLP